MKTRSIFLSVVVLTVIIFSIFRFLNQPRRSEYVFYPMGGIPCNIVEYARSSERFAEDIKLVEARIDELEDIFNGYRVGSEVSRLNNSNAGEWYPVSREMYELLGRSLTWYGRTAGAFDVTVFPLVRLWKEAGEAGRLPSQTGLDSVQSVVGSSYITLSPEKGVRFFKKGMSLDFGGIAKGFILDEVGRLLAVRGVERYVVSCGGDVIMKGKERFRVGIKDPEGASDDLMVVLDMPPGSVVTSGHYERYVEIAGKRYSHIIDPATGLPVDNDLVSITIIGANTTDIDALATSVAVLGFEESLKLLRGSGAYKAVLLRKVGGSYEFHYSRELAGRLEYKGKWAALPRIEF